MSVSIIVPMLNEAATLPRFLEYLQPFKHQSDVEILLVDGGSTDESRRIAEAANFPVISSVTGRAMQMNAGANATRGELLLFLHADTQLPPLDLRMLQVRLQERGY